MTVHWLPHRGPETASTVPRPGRFDLSLHRDGVRTAIGKQFVSYPFHLTRAFALDPLIPELLTVYQQSSSGGLYRSDVLSSSLDMGAYAAAHVTTQAATVVHDCHGLPASQSLHITAGRGSFLAYTPDPFILFPQASLNSRTRVQMADGTVIMLLDAFAMHDPTGALRMFDTLTTDVEISNTGGKVLVLDRGRIEGKALAAPASPLGPWKLYCSILLLGDPARLPAPDGMAEACKTDGVVAAASSLPNAAGWCIRCLAADAAGIRALTGRVFDAAVFAAFGSLPAARRK